MNCLSNHLANVFNSLNIYSCDNSAVFTTFALAFIVNAGLIWHSQSVEEVLDDLNKTKNEIEIVPGR